jgi:hypothetical protein
MANERIKELMGQALDEKFAGTWSVMDLQDLTKFADRFAELIVKECLKIVEPDQTSGDEWCVTLDETAQSIRQHFGVEE